MVFFSAANHLLQEQLHILFLFLNTINFRKYIKKSWLNNKKKHEGYISNKTLPMIHERFCSVVGCSFHYELGTEVMIGFHESNTVHFFSTLK